MGVTQLLLVCEIGDLVEVLFNKIVGKKRQCSRSCAIDVRG